MSKFDILRKRFNQIPVGEKFDFMDLINDLGYSHKRERKQLELWNEK